MCRGFHSSTFSRQYSPAPCLFYLPRLSTQMALISSLQPPFLLECSLMSFKIMTPNVPVSHHNQGPQPALALRKANTTLRYSLSYLATIQDEAPSGHLSCLFLFIPTLLCAFSPTPIPLHLSFSDLSIWHAILKDRQTLPWKLSHFLALNETWFSLQHSTSPASPYIRGPRERVGVPLRFHRYFQAITLPTLLP